MKIIKKILETICHFKGHKWEKGYSNDDVIKYFCARCGEVNIINKRR